jgi:flagellar assembly protein FliH
MRTSSRFIPGEEIDAVSQWSFGAVDTASLRALAKAQAAEDAAGAARDNAVREQAYAQGFSQGLARATVEADHRVAEFARTQGRETAQRLAQLVASAQEQLDAARQTMAQGVLELACEMARQVLRHELSVNPNVLQPVIREALSIMIADSKQATLRLNALDLEVVREAMQAEFDGMALALVADPKMQPGSCVIESAGTVVDASMPTRWRRVVANLGLELAWDE